MHSITLRLLRAAAFFAIFTAYLICGEARAEAEIDLGSQRTVSLETKVLWPKEYGLYLMLQKRPDLHSELRRNGYGVSPPNQTTDDPKLLTFTIRIYEWGSGRDELIFEQSNLQPSLLMTLNEEAGLEIAAIKLAPGRYRIEATPENTNHTLANIPARLIVIKALRGK
ncbi:hypothetical protein [Leisingera caerulea]|uniref:hypothetical protein n=1 Tax=Leisingera caerulea TaxID=506591 RepID=UPI00048979AA|nr:hypothetical protein [Leisingera caerulea]